MTQADIQAKKAANRARLLTTATGHFKAVGYERTRTRDIAAAAGLSTAVIFDNWGSKAALFTEAMGRPPIEDKEASRLLEALKVARRVLVVACGDKAPYIRVALDQIDPALAPYVLEIAAPEPQQYGTPISEISTRPGTPGYDEWLRISESWGHP